MLKKLLISLIPMLFALNSFSVVKVGTVLALAFSNQNSVFEDELIKVELVGADLVVTNKTNKIIFIDRVASVVTENEFGRQLSRLKVPSFDEAPMPIPPRQNWKITNIVDYFGHMTVDAYTGTTMSGVHDFYTGEFLPDYNQSHKINAQERNLLNIMDGMYKELGGLMIDGGLLVRGGDYTSAKRHITENESFLNLTATIVYDTDIRMEHRKTAMVSTWASDVVFGAALYNEKRERKQEKERKRLGGLAISDDAKVGHTFYVLADKPFADDAYNNNMQIYYVDYAEIDYGMLILDNVLNGFQIGSDGASAGVVIAAMFGNIGDIMDARRDAYRKAMKERAKGGGGGTIVWGGRYKVSDKEGLAKFKEFVKSIDK